MFPCNMQKVPRSQVSEELFACVKGRTLVITQLCVRASFFTAGMYLDFEVNSIPKDIICADS